MDASADYILLLRRDISQAGPSHAYLRRMYTSFAKDIGVEKVLSDSVRMLYRQWQHIKMVEANINQALWTLKPLPPPPPASYDMVRLVGYHIVEESTSTEDQNSFAKPEDIGILSSTCN